MTRMEQVIERLQRFTSLDRAEHQLVDLNQLVADVVAFAQEPVLEIRLKTVELPPLYCHRASLTTSVASVLRSVCEGCRIPGGCRRVDIHTRICDGWVEVHISCRSKRFATEDIEALFNPSFQTADGRISSGDWSLFAARQVIEGLGGEVRVCSAPNKATTFTIKLPAGAWAIPSQKTECASHEAAPAVG